METTPKVSVIIPVYNAEKYLRQCLDSVLVQSLKNIEIICVDDASTDSSLQILEEYKNKDSRLNVHTLEKKSSALVARKKGILLSSGEYILFIDSDDYIAQDTCENIYNKIVLENVEILHFSSVIENCGNLALERIKMNEKLLKPYEQRLEASAVFETCFLKQSYGFTLWNKLFSSKLCKTAVSYIDDDFLPKAQDLYFYFVISYFAKSYLGWNSPPYYHYCFGRGITGSNTITLETFERYCRQVDVVQKLYDFSLKQNIADKTEKVIERYRNQWLDECIQMWISDIDMNIAKEAVRMLWKYWDTSIVIERIANRYWYSRDKVARRIGGSFSVSLAEKNIKTIGVYYYHYTIGGVQRVLSLLMPVLQDLGYKVLLITDKEPSKNDFELPDGVQRVTIFDYEKVKKENLKQRLCSWKNILEKYSVDIVIYHAWTSPILLWDTLFLKRNSIPVVIQTHSIFSYSLISHSKDFSSLPYVLSLGDGIITLSNVDKAFWDCFNNNVHYIPNPVGLELENVKKTDGTHKNIVWVGRFSNEKQPWYAIDIMKYVVQQEPDAILYMIGGAKKTTLVDKYQKTIDRNGLSRNIKLLGFQQNVKQYYSTARVNLITSLYEGYPMVLLEAQAHGVPTVMYEMPFLELGRYECGVIGVEQNNCRQAATEIIRLLRDQSQWEHLSKMAAKSFLTAISYDYPSAWRKILSGAPSETSINDVEKVMVKTILQHYLMGWEKNQISIRRIKKDNLKGEKSNLLLWVFRKLRGGIRCCQEHGLRYTLHHAKEKFKAFFGGSR